MPLVPVNRKGDWIDNVVRSLFPFAEELLEFLTYGYYKYNDDGLLILKIFEVFPERGELEVELYGELFNDSLGEFERIDCVRRYGVLL
jgi:hypothetical protein